MKIAFLAVQNDSRCPKNVDCAWAGMVTLNIQVNEKKAIMSLLEGSFAEQSYTKPNLNANSNNVYETDTAIIYLAQVNPYPEVGKKIKPNEYIATFFVKNK